MTRWLFSESSVAPVVKLLNTRCIVASRPNQPHTYGTPPRTLRVLALALAALLLVAAPVNARAPLLQAGKQTLYQRVLTVPGARIAKTAGGGETTLAAAFSRYYLYDRRAAQGTEWLEVGTDTKGSIQGWIRADQTVPWKQQLALAFTNPAGRGDRPALFFRGFDDLSGILAAPDPGEAMRQLQTKIIAGDRDPRAVAREPAHHVDINQAFYLLPILDFKELYLPQGDILDALEVASVSAQQPEPPNQPRTITNFRSAVVFVIDTTISMRPYIDQTRASVKRIYDRIEAAGLADDEVRFGLVAYRARDPAIPGLEYGARTFADPSEIQSGADFLAKVKEVEEARVSTRYFTEDALLGLDQALSSIDWSDFGGRYIVLVTDAGALEGDKSATGTGVAQMRSEAQARGVAVYGLHLKTPAGRDDHAGAEAQYRVLADNDYVQDPLYFDIQAGAVDRYGKVLDTLADTLIDQIEQAARGKEVAGSARTASRTQGPDQAPADRQLEDLRRTTQALGHAMQLAYLGRVEGTRAPLVFQGWIADLDLTDPAKRTVEPRLLLTKNQLSDLVLALDRILTAAEGGLARPHDFYAQLRSLAAQFSRDPALANRPEATRLADLGLLGEYLEDLPYRSRVMNLDQDTWSRWGTHQQVAFIDELKNKIRLYRRYNADPGRWIDLVPGGPPDDAVYPIPLTDLP